MNNLARKGVPLSRGCRQLFMPCGVAIQATYTVQIAEAIAIYRGIVLAMESGLFPKEIESDAATVVGWIGELRQVESEVGQVIKAIILALQQLSYYKVKCMDMNVLVAQETMQFV
ncbi:hypothetical protein Dsin_020019 [Dipteronia sinensis]|uniref:RNase H type-1 domain-containing protein n=1 Tax=Dipteronia sinensis TaxID=43782 RepID=A0AAE0A9L6_9ROSI|nr:hypothetical protein Dsin_020019 [Dipteronia sinensis]